MNKKFISAVMAGAMAVSALGVVASADITPATQENAEMEKAGSKSYAISAQMQAVALNVTLPSSVRAVINPYGVTVTIEDVGKTSTAGVTSPVYTIANNTEDMAVIVKATASAEIPKGSTAKIAANKTNPSAATSAVTLANETNHYVYAEVFASTALTTDPAALDTPVVFLEKDAAPQELLKLTKAASATAPEKGYFQISGDLAGKPATPFSTTDKVNYTLVLDIEPANPTTVATSAVGSGA